MRIENPERREEWDTVVLFLTRAEATELRDSLTALLERCGESHEHVSNADFTKEITVCTVI